MARKRNSDQFPLFTPDSDWVVPTELPDLRGRGHIALDTETRDDGLANDRGPGWVYKAGWVCGVSMATTGQAVYVPVRHPDTECHDHDAVRRWLADHLASDDTKIFHNAAYDIGWLWAEWGLEPPAKIDDTHAMAVMLDENRLSYSLDSVATWQGVPGKDEAKLREAAEIFGCDPKSEMWKLPARYVGPYAEQDPRTTEAIYLKMLPQLIGQEVLEAYRLEMDLIPMIFAMRRRGIRIDLDRAAEARVALLQRRDEALAEITRQSTMRRPVTIKDINSPRFLEMIFDEEKIPYPRTSKTKQGSFKTEWMEKSDHWLPTLVTQALKAHDAGEKFISNYVVDFTHRGRLHAEVHQLRSDDGGTRSYRFSYSNPPLQQMPSRNPDLMRLIRGVFVPEDGQIWGAHDYSQQEFRLIVHFAMVCGIASAEEAVKKYQQNPRTDFHDLVAEMTRLPRKKAKDTNFAKAFGAGRHKFALMTGMSVEEATEVMHRYDTEMPFVSRLSEFCQARADRRGFIRLLDGARSRFDFFEPRWRDRDKEEEWLSSGGDLRLLLPTGCTQAEAMRRVRDPSHPWSGRVKRAFTHKAMNRLIQGSAARQVKMAMRQIWRAGVTPLIQMHDELGFSHERGEAGRREAVMVGEVMRDVVKLSVPMVVDSEFGQNWGDATHNWEEVDGE